jgi:small nuclear ribonucleoprotein
VINLEPSKKPLNLLIKKMNQGVTVKLKNNIEYKGKIIDCDGHMNVILEGATEYISNEATANFGRVIVRGNNVLYICIENPEE